MRREACSEDGYIIDQRAVDDVRYGKFFSDYNGCGWIACYNLLKIMERERPADAVCRALEKGSLFRGLLGTGPFRIRRYLRRQGLRVRTAVSKKRAARIAPAFLGGMLLYRHAGGYHFAAFANLGGGQFRFYNAICGHRCHDRSMQAFLAQENKAALVLCYFVY